MVNVLLSVLQDFRLVLYIEPTVEDVVVELGSAMSSNNVLALYAIAFLLIVAHFHMQLYIHSPVIQISDSTFLFLLRFS